MKRFLAFVTVFLALYMSAHAQYARRIVSVTALPALCNPLNGDIVNLTAAGPIAGLYACTGTNTWRPAGVNGNQLVINQGTLTANTPVFQQTATWNNAGVTFVNDLRTITDTASNAASLLADWIVGATHEFTVSKAGDMVLNGNITGGGNAGISATGAFFFNTRSSMRSSADGMVNFLNGAGTDFTRLVFGPVAVTNPAIQIPAAVGGQAQGIIITRGDGTSQIQANLGAATNGSIIYCADCTIANPCAGGGTGAIAKRLNGVWVCN